MRKQYYCSKCKKYFEADEPQKVSNTLAGNNVSSTTVICPICKTESNVSEKQDSLKEDYDYIDELLKQYGGGCRGGGCSCG